MTSEFPPRHSMSSSPRINSPGSISQSMSSVPTRGSKAHERLGFRTPSCHFSDSLLNLRKQRSLKQRKCEAAIVPGVRLT